MKVARLAVLGVALVAGFLAWRLASNLGTGDVAPTVVSQNVSTDEVLVAQKDIVPGAVLSSADLGWEQWPRDAINSAFVTRSGEPDAMEKLAGSVARTSFFSGEPIRDAKLVRSGAGGFLSAMLPPGMRAVSTKTSPEIGAGGFILPNDRVDVVLTRPETGGRSGGKDTLVTETILENVRVLAIDQTVEEKDGRMVVVGNVATLELRPEQVEILALSEQLGDLSLSLRSIMDGAPDDANALTAAGLAGPRGVVRIVKFGVPSQVSTR